MAVKKQFRSPRERATFVSAKVAKTIAPGMTVSATSCCRNFPARLADRAPARTRTSLCSDMRALLARSTAMLGVMQRRGSRFDTRPSMACVIAHGNDFSHVMNAVITKSNARITIDENTTVRVVEYATPSLVGGAV
ncbi:MAG TPA: hypothetical protein VJQ86_08205 [Rhodanobacteraceae bacterium]|nr:hypothetical protein [Rhodanobacteraceae bacterium]